jgi:hypothetical protein
MTVHDYLFSLQLHPTASVGAGGGLIITLADRAPFFCLFSLFFLV